MYIHIGNDRLVLSKDIIGIFDIEKTTASPVTREYLRAAALRSCEISCTDQLPRSFVVTFDRKQLDEKVYISRVSSATIGSRSNGGNEENE